MPYVDFSGQGWNSSQQTVRIYYSESVVSGKIRVALDKVQFKSSVTLTGPLYGLVKFGTTTVKAFNGGTGGYQVTTDGSSFVDVPNSSGSYVDVTYSTSAATKLSISVDANPNAAVTTIFGATFVVTGGSRNFDIGTVPKSTDATLTTYQFTTAVSPSGYGTVTAGQWMPPGVTKSLAATPAAQTAEYTYSLDNPAWALSGAGSSLSTTTSSPTTFTMGSAAATVTAKFKRTARSYNVSLTAGSHIASVSGGGSKVYNTSVTATAVLASATGYTYAFDGWYQNGAKVSSSLSYTFAMPASAVALTAVGTRSANTYSVKFGPNGGTGTMANESFTYDVSKELTANAFTRTGYTFLGWSTDPNATTPTYTDKQNVSNLAPSGTITLYAVWQLNTYRLSVSQTKSTVSVNRTSSPLGGGSTGNLSNGATLYHNDVLKITFTANTGYTMSVHTVNGSSFSSGASHTVVGAVAVVSTATANSYSVAFNANRGTGTGSGTMNNQGFTYDQEKALTANAYTRQILVTFNYTGGTGTPESSPAVSVFNGWARSAAGAVVYSNGQKVSNLTATQNGTVTLYAKWTNGNVALPTPTRTGYAFKGWYTAATGGTRVGGAGAKYSPTAPITLYAQWTLLEFTLDLTTSDNGLAVNVLRSASPIGGGGSGLLSNGATLYYNDAITVSYSVNQGYQLNTATVNGEDISATGRKSVTVSSNLVVVITVDLGAIVYIGNEAYQAFIGDGTSYGQYEAFFGNGSGYDPY